MSSLAARVRPLLATCAVMLALAPMRTHAQVTSVAFAPSCGPGTGCGLVRFVFGGFTTDTGIASIAFTSSSSAFTFSSTAGLGTYAASDAFGPFGGASMITGSGRMLAIDFLASGFALTVPGNGTAFLDVALDQDDGPPLAFTYTGVYETGAPFVGAVPSTVPEPAVLSLVGAGLLAMGGAVRLRRRV